MVNMVIYSLILSMICLSLMLLTVLTYKTRSDKEKVRPFERGFDPCGTSRLQFCMKFFLVGVIFLVFDVEVRLIMPLPYRQIFIFLFLFILTLGLAYE